MVTEIVKNSNDLRWALQKVAKIIADAKGTVFEFSFKVVDLKTREQEKKYHAMLGDIAKQEKHLNEVLDVDSWKRLCVKQFADDCIANDVDRLADYWRKNGFKLMPSLDGKSLVTLGKQTRHFPKYVAAGFIEWLMAYGANNKIVWSDPQYAEEYERNAA